jgi:hypothetical protein
MSQKTRIVALTIGLTATVLAGFCLGTHQSKEALQSLASAVWGS